MLRKIKNSAVTVSTEQRTDGRENLATMIESEKLDGNEKHRYDLL